MPQGKLLSPNNLRAICTDLLVKIPFSKICKNRKISSSTLGAISTALHAHEINSTFELNDCDDLRLTQIIYGERSKLANGDTSITISRNTHPKGASPDFIPVDFQALVRRFSDNSSLTKEDLYRDYVLEAKAQGLKYLARTTFLRRLRKAIAEHKGPNVYMRREHPFGDALQIDWCGMTFPITIDEQGTTKNCPVIVTAWPASYYVYAEIMPDMTTANTIHSLRRALIWFGCIPNRFVVDNAKALVSKHKAGREAIFNASFEFFASQCGIQLDANNPYSPNEKSCVETSVRLVQQRVLNRMDQSLPRYLDEANRELMQKVNLFINDADFRGGGNDDTRAILFLKHEKPAARRIDVALPDYIEHLAFLSVGLDYCVEIKEASYSVPYTYAGQKVSADISNNMIRIYDKQGKEIACHPLVAKGNSSILHEHMPKNHQVIKERELKYKTPSDIIATATSISIQLASFCQAMLSRGSFVDRKKGCISMINEYKRHPEEHQMLDEAISRALHLNLDSHLSSYAVMEQLKELRDFASKHNGHFPIQLDLLPPASSAQVPQHEDHSFIRGNDELLKDLELSLETIDPSLKNKE